MNRISETRKKPQLVLRKFNAAEGYMELGLPSRAIEELESINDPGKFEPLWHSMYGEALRARGDLRAAISHLTQAASQLGPVKGQQAWHSLADCHRKLGDLETAYHLEGAVQSAESILALKKKAMKMLTALSSAGVIDQLKPIRIVINTESKPE